VGAQDETENEFAEVEMSSWQSRSALSAADPGSRPCVSTAWLETPGNAMIHDESLSRSSCLFRAQSFRRGLVRNRSGHGL